MKAFVRSAAKDALQNIVFPGRFVWRLPASTRGLALTFDDGPHPEWTPAALDMLGRAGVRATFFLIGREVQKHPGIVRRIVAEGHAVGGHSFDHTVITGQSPAALVADLAHCRDAIAEACGTATRLFRPPRGEVSFGSIRTVCRAGFTLVHWSKTYSDYKHDGAPALMGRIERLGAHERDILLFHDNNGHTVEALGRAVPRWAEAGHRFEILRETRKCP
jgi:peptidoglycan/xylan/chitin deacetylase (PgdA/CDA1 family)